ncbi:MAG: hypothetical protein C0610_16615 [Desulfobacteraceae bacterium]|nr:MAG: hypothetical protein C0610_16615 [Desulfobacteraceae bacterium]
MARSGKLFIRRQSQSDSIEQAKRDGSDYFVGVYNTHYDLQKLKTVVRNVVDCMDSNEKVEFWEESS